MGINSSLEGGLREAGSCILPQLDSSVQSLLPSLT